MSETPKELPSPMPMPTTEEALKVATALAQTLKKTVTHEELVKVLKSILEEAEDTKIRTTGRRGFRNLAWNLPFSNGMKLAVRRIEDAFPEIKVQETKVE